jgi:hypothetical protein
VHERQTTESGRLVEKLLRGGPREGTETSCSHDYEA